MSKLSYVILVMLTLLIVGGVTFLATWEIPAPSAVVEKEIPDERFQR